MFGSKICGFYHWHWKIIWSVIGVLIKPGLIKDTLTFFLFISKCKLSAKLVRADFEAQYAPSAGNPRYPATDEIIDICPDFFWTDGENQKRVWSIEKIDEHNHIGTAADVVGEAKGFSYGSAFKFEYDLIVPFKGKSIKISFDDWIFKQDEDVAINRATLTKFGFKVGELTVFFKKN